MTPSSCKTLYYIIIYTPLLSLHLAKTDIFESRNLGGARWVASQPVAKITIDPEPCMTMLLKKLQKSDRSLGDYCLCMQHIFKDQPGLLRVSGEMRSATRNSQAYRFNVLSVNTAHISTHTEATQTLLNWEL